MDYIRKVDFGAFPASEYHYETLANRDRGFDQAICIATRLPAGVANPVGLHTHPIEQFLYVTSGTLTIQLGAQKYTAGPDSLIFIPAGLVHNNWNESGEPETHFEMMCPHPQLGEPASVKVQEARDLPGAPEFIRKLDRGKFDLANERLSELNLGNRESGVTSLSWNVFRVPPGGGIRGAHIHGFTHIYYVLSGVMKLKIGVNDYELGPDTMGIVPAGVVHTNWNEGTEPEYHLNIRVPEPDSPHMQGVRVQITEPIIA